MKVLHIIPSISQDTGGPSRSCQGLVAELCRAGVDAWYYGFRGVEPWFAGVRSFKPVGAELTVEDIKGFDLVHLHSVWLWPMHKAAKLCRKAGVKYVVAPRGMLEPWSLKQKWLKKKIAWWLYLRNDLKKAAALHATAASEEAQFRKLGLKQKVIVSPNGVNLPDGNFGTQVPSGHAELGETCVPTPRPADGRHNCVSPSCVSKRVLFMSRMHAKKGVSELIEAWKRVGSRVEGVGSREWVLELVYTVRNDEERAYEQKCKDLVLALGMSYQDKDGNIHCPTPTHDSHSNIIFTGALDDEKKWEAYGRANLFVLPTYSENFGIVVAEALWAGVPVITTKGTPWREIQGEVVEISGRMEDKNLNSANRCGWWIDIGVEPLCAALKEAITIDSTTTTNDYNSLARMGENGHALVARKYTWTAIGERMVKEYENLLRK